MIRPATCSTTAVQGSPVGTYPVTCTGASRVGYTVTYTAGTLTVGTDKPAYPPWFQDDDPKNGKGFESAVAYAVADELILRIELPE